MSQFIFIWLLCNQFALSLSKTEKSLNTSFSIDFENNQFLLDGEPFRYYLLLIRWKIKLLLKRKFKFIREYGKINN